MNTVDDADKRNLENLKSGDFQIGNGKKNHRHIIILVDK